MTEIILYDEKQANAVTLFNGDGLDPFIQNIKDVAENFEGDLSTPKGRKEIISLAYKIGNAKNRIDDMRVEENAEHQAKIKANNARGKTAWDELEALQKKVRKPVTDWENQDKERIEKHKEVLAVIENMGEFSDWQKYDISQMQSAIKRVEEYHAREWSEFAFKADKIKEQVILLLKNAIKCKTDYEAQQAELEKLRKAEEERKQKERDNLIAKEAAEAAKKEAEEAAEAQRQRIWDKLEAEKQEAAKREAAIQEAKDKAVRDAKDAEERAAAATKKAEMRISAERARASSVKREAALRVKRAEEAVVEAEEKATRDAVAAVEAAKKAAEDAIEESKRVAQDIADRLNKEVDDKKKAEAADLAKREADVAHKNKIIRDIEKAFVDLEGFPQRSASNIAAAIASGNIPHVTIKY